MAKFILQLVAIASLAMSVQVQADGISSAEKVYADVNKSIMMIFNIKNHDYNKPVGYGSSVAITKNILATNCHVALKTDESVVKINKQFKSTTLIYKNELQDLCLLKISEKTLSPVRLRNASTVRIGEEVFTIGSPKGFERTISRGIISNKIKYQTTAILQTDASISPGSSGGGLFDTHSRLIGITFSKNEGEGAEGLGFALPTELISAIIHHLQTV